MELLISNIFLLTRHNKYSDILISTVKLEVTTGQYNTLQYNTCISYKSENHFFLPEVPLGLCHLYVGVSLVS